MRGVVKLIVGVVGSKAFEDRKLAVGIFKIDFQLKRRLASAQFIQKVLLLQVVNRIQLVAQTAHLGGNFAKVLAVGGVACAHLVNAGDGDFDGEERIHNQQQKQHDKSGFEIKSATELLQFGHVQKWLKGFERFLPIKII